MLDLHAAFDRGHGQVGAVCAVKQEGDVVLLDDVAGFGDQHLMNDVALDVQAKNGFGFFLGFSRSLGELDATGFSSATGLHLGLDHNGGADLFGCIASGRGGSDDDSRLRRYAVLSE